MSGNSSFSFTDEDLDVDEGTVASQVLPSNQDLPISSPSFALCESPHESHSSSFSFTDEELDVDEGTTANVVTPSVQETEVSPSLRNSVSELNGDEEENSSFDYSDEELDVDEGIVTEVAFKCSQEAEELSRISNVIENETDESQFRFEEENLSEEAEEEKISSEEEEKSEEEKEEEAEMENEDTKIITFVVSNGNEEESENVTDLNKNRLKLIKEKFSAKKTKRKEFRVPLYSRMLLFEQTVEAKTEQKAALLETEVLAECTFEPSVHKFKPIRRLDEFLKSQENFLKQKNEKIEDLKNLLMEKELAECKEFKSSLNRKIKLIEKETFQKEAEENCSTSSSDRTCKFMPTINEKSKNLKRERPVCEILYEDAKRRLEKPETSKNLEFLSPVNKKSHYLLVAKFKKEFNLSFREIDPDEREVLPYSLYIAILEKLRFIENEPHSRQFLEERRLCLKAWESLSEEDFISKEELYEFLLAVLNLASFSDPGSILLKGFWNIHKEFNLFYENRMKIHHSHICLEAEKPYKPFISPESSAIARIKETKRLEEYGPDFLVIEKDIEVQKFKRRFDIEQKKLSFKFSFRPKINKFQTERKEHPEMGLLSTGLRDLLKRKQTQKISRRITLFTMSLVMQEKFTRIEKEVEQVEKNEYKMECTFSPRLRRSLMEGKKPANEISEFASTVERLRLGRKEREVLKKLMERGSLINSKALGELPKKWKSKKWVGAYTRDDDTSEIRNMGCF